MYGPGLRGSQEGRAFLTAEELAQIQQRRAQPLTLDPTSGKRFDPDRRMRDILARYAQSPGRAPGGSGRTGLLAGDEAGWRRLLDEQQQLAAIADLGEGAFEPGARSRLQYRPVEGYQPRSPYGALPSTLFDPLQHSAITGRSFDQENEYQKGLRQARARQGF